MSDVPPEWVQACKSLHKKKVYIRSNKNGNMLQKGGWKERACCGGPAMGKDQKLLIEYTGESNLVFIVWRKGNNPMHREPANHIQFRGQGRGDAEKFHLEFRGEELFMTPFNCPYRVYVRDDRIVGSYGGNGKTWGPHESFAILDLKGKPALPPMPGPVGQAPPPATPSQDKTVSDLHKKVVFLVSKHTGNVLQNGGDGRLRAANKNMMRWEELTIEFSGQDNVVSLISGKNGNTLTCTPQGELKFANKNRGLWERFGMEFKGGDVFFVSKHINKTIQVGKDGLARCANQNRLGWEAFTLVHKDKKAAPQPVPAQGPDKAVSDMNGQLVWLVSKHTGKVVQNSEGGTLRAVSTNMLGWEQITIEYSGQENIVFLVSGKDGSTLTCTPHGELNFANKNRGLWERFGMEFKGSDVFFVSKHINKTIQVGKDGLARCANQNRLGWEAFTLVPENKTSLFHAQHGHRKRLEDCWTTVARSVNGTTGYAQSNFNGKLIENHGHAKAIGESQAPRGEIMIEYSGEVNIVFLVSVLDGNTLQCSQKGELTFASKGRGEAEKFRVEIHGASAYFVSCRIKKTIQVGNDGTMSCANENRGGRESFKLIPTGAIPKPAPTAPDVPEPTAPLLPAAPTASIQRAPSAKPSKVKCSSCNRKNPADARFCSKCGKGLVEGVVCAKCFAVCPEDDSFCIKCGHDLSAPAGGSAAPTVHVNLSMPANQGPPPYAYPAPGGPVTAFPNATGMPFGAAPGVSPFPVGQGMDGQPQMIYIPEDPIPAEPISKSKLAKVFKKFGF